MHVFFSFHVMTECICRTGTVLSKAARQIAKIRRAFLDAALMYEMSYFDREGCTGDAMF